MIYEVFLNGSAVNTIVASQDFMKIHYPDGNYRVIQDEVTPAIVVKRHIAVGSFFDRLGAEKYNVLASTDPTVQALVKDASVRKFIDLDRADLLLGLQMVQSKGFNIDPQAIVSAEIQPDEKP